MNQEPDALPASKATESAASHDHGAEAAAEHGLVRSEHWPAVERSFRTDNPTCAACFSTAVQVHHVMPFHYCILAGRPDLELDPRNLISLCEKEKAAAKSGGEAPQDHHLLIGHLDDFKSYNPRVREDVAAPPEGYGGLAELAIKDDSAWQTEEHAKPKLWPDMSEDERTAFRATLDAMYPAPYVNPADPFGAKLDHLPTP